VNFDVSCAGHGCNQGDSAEGFILHFDQGRGTGLIRANDGGRYAFDLEQWRSAEAPRDGFKVDFETEGERASDVYLLPPASLPAANSASPAAGAGPQAPDIGSFLARRPGIIPAAAILVGCFLPFVSVAFVSPNLFGFVGFVTQVSRPAFAFRATPFGVQFALSCAYLLYAIPGSAAWLLYREIREEASPGLRVRVGLTGLLGPFAIYLLMLAMISLAMPATRIRSNDLNFLRAVSFAGLGWILIATASVALIIIGRRVLRPAPFEADQDDAGAAPTVEPEPRVASRTCPSCGKQYGGELIFCPRDGTDLI
jgi:hypothetical protein